VAEEVARILDEHRSTDDVVVLDSPLLVETGTYRACDTVVVVRADPELRVARLVARGMDAADVRARIAAQAPTAEQVAVADVVVDNEGTPEELAARIDALWRDLSSAG